MQHATVNDTQEDIRARNGSEPSEKIIKTYGQQHKLEEGGNRNRIHLTQWTCRVHQKPKAARQFNEYSPGETLFRVQSRRTIGRPTRQLYIACDRTSSPNSFFLFFFRIDQETCRIVSNTIRLKEKKGAEFISLSLFGGYCC